MVRNFSFITKTAFRSTACFLAACLSTLSWLQKCVAKYFYGSTECGSASAALRGTISSSERISKPTSDQSSEVNVTYLSGWSCSGLLVVSAGS